MGVVWRKAAKTAEKREGRDPARPQGKGKGKGKGAKDGKRR